MILPGNWRTPDLDIGADHFVWFGHGPDWPDPCECGAEHSEHFNEYIWVVHPHKQTGLKCLGACNTAPGGWVIESRDPLTIAPSVACSCGDHGFIQNGKWVPA